MHDRVANLLGATALNVADLALSAIRQVADVGDSASAALVTLAEHPRLSVTGLGGRIGLSQPAAARMVDGLIERGLVTRQPGSGRTVEIQLTRSGRRTAAKLLNARSQALGELIKDMDAHELETLARLLGKVLYAVHPCIQRTSTTPPDQIGILVCRLCDRAACRQHGEPCPVTEAQNADARAEDRHG